MRARRMMRVSKQRLGTEGMPAIRWTGVWRGGIIGYHTGKGARMRGPPCSDRGVGRGARRGHIGGPRVGRLSGRRVCFRLL